MEINHYEKAKLEVEDLGNEYLNKVKRDNVVAIDVAEIIDDFVHSGFKLINSYSKANLLTEEEFGRVAMIVGKFENEIHARYLTTTNDRPVGRPPVGVTKKVSLTLPEAIWEYLETTKGVGQKSLSAAIRHIMMDYYEMQKRSALERDNEGSLKKDY